MKIQSDMEHIKITDLCVGNWVEYDREHYRVIQIDEESQHVLISGLSGVKDKHIDYIEPICIKPEMLKKNGIIDEEMPGYDDFTADNLYLTRQHGDKYWSLRIFVDNIVPKVRCSIQHIHQLQNAMRLAGIDKEIEL